MAWQVAGGGALELEPNRSPLFTSCVPLDKLPSLSVHPIPVCKMGVDGLCLCPIKNSECLTHY